MDIVRVFIAVNFPGSVKKQISDISSKIRAEIVKGNLTKSENFHLTLAFIGEIPESRLKAVEKAMDKISFRPFELTMKGIGRFKRNGGDIIWIGIEPSEGLKTLEGIQQDLVRELKDAGFVIDDRGFRPHMTLGREVVTESWDKVKNAAGDVGISVRSEKISLMRSERINGKLTYTEIYAKESEGAV